MLTAICLSAFLSCEKEPDVTDPLKERDKTSTITGTIKYDDGTPASNVVVSDGYTCTATDKDGKYTLKKNSDAFYVFYSIPADAAVEAGANGLPGFYKKIVPNTSTYDFKLRKKAVEKQFRLLGVGDIQVKTAAQIKRYANETQVDLKEFSRTHTDMPNYAIHLGDLASNDWSVYPDIVPKVGMTAVGMPMFQVIGNHDHVFPSKDNITAQRTYEEAVSPVTYSFNIGDVHVISADDVIHTATESSAYDGGFLTWQYEWLKQDLSYVSTDKHIVLAVHIPFRTYFYKNYNMADKEGAYYDEVLALLAKYRSATILSGHIHCINNTYKHVSGGKTIQEYAIGAACGAHWNGTCCYDGAPNGYGVLEFDGTTLKNLYYKPTLRSEKHQMRIYYAPDFPDFTYNLNGVNLNCSWGLKTVDNTYVVNIWNMTDEWTTEVYEDGTLTGSLNRKDFAEAYSMHYFYQYNKAHLDEADGKRYHMYYYRPKNRDLKELKVIAHDPFGNVYECSKITRPDDTEIINY